MTNYANPQVMQKVMKKARDAGIFAYGKNERRTKYNFIMNLDERQLYLLNLYDYEDMKLFKYESDLGMISTLRKPVKFKLDTRRTFFGRYISKIEFISVSDESDRAWERTINNVYILYFKDKKGVCWGLITDGGKFIMEEKEAHPKK